MIRLGLAVDTRKDHNRAEDITDAHELDLSQTQR
jgi:hypothetical protein